jgi:hypothetical protein
MRLLYGLSAILVIFSGSVDARRSGGSTKAPAAPTAAPLDLNIPLNCIKQYPQYSTAITSCVKEESISSCLQAFTGAKEFLGGCCNGFRASASPLAQKVVTVCDKLQTVNVTVPESGVSYLSCAEQVHAAVSPCWDSMDLKTCAKSAETALKTCCPILQEKAKDSMMAELAYSACTKLEQYLPSQ